MKVYKCCTKTIQNYIKFCQQIHVTFRKLKSFTQVDFVKSHENRKYFVKRKRFTRDHLFPLNPCVIILKVLSSTLEIS